MRVVFRADASPLMGAGHISRCLTIAEELSRLSCKISFLSRTITPELAQKLSAAGMDLELLTEGTETRSALPYNHSSWLGVTEQEDAEECLGKLESSPADWLVVDHYALAQPWEKHLRAAARHVLVIDDLADRPHACDILLDSSIGDSACARYQSLVTKETLLLAGPRHAILRREFAAPRENPKDQPELAKKIFVCFGAYDSADLTSRALDALALCKGDYLVDVVLGRSAPHLEALREKVARHPGWQLHVQAGNVAHLMSAADLAIGAAGQMTFERACLGLPALAISAAQNQKPQLEAAARLGILHSYPPDNIDTKDLARKIDWLATDATQRRAMSKKAMQVVDGKGTQRICREMLQRIEIGVRPASHDDMALVYQWRTDERTIAVSRSQSRFTMQEHQEWFSRKISSKDCLMLIAHIAGAPCGVLRFDLEDSTAHVSIFLAPQFIGYGLGERVLAAGERALLTSLAGKWIIQAHVLEHHDASKSLFARSGYIPSGETWTKHQVEN